MNEANREMCICAAIRLRDRRIFRGHRHADCMRTAREYIEYRFSIGLEPYDYEEQSHELEQGFMTSSNRFVDRGLGLHLQLAAGVQSAARGGYRPPHLFSEDLY